MFVLTWFYCNCISDYGYSNLIQSNYKHSRGHTRIISELNLIQTIFKLLTGTIGLPLFTISRLSILLLQVNDYEKQINQLKPQLIAIQEERQRYHSLIQNRGIQAGDITIELHKRLGLGPAPSQSQAEARVRGEIVSDPILIAFVCSD